MSIIRRLSRCQSGSTAVEFAITGLAFAMLSVGTIECGRALYIRNHIAHASDVAVRKMLVKKAATDQEVEEALQGALSQADPSLLDIELTTEVADDVTQRRLVVRYPLTVGFPGLAIRTLTLELERTIALAEERWWLER